MDTRLLLIICLFDLSVAAQDIEPPFSKPAKLEFLFKDDFEKDSRSDYLVGAKKEDVTWEKDFVRLSGGSLLHRKFESGSWVELNLDLTFPVLSEDGQASGIKIWLDFAEGADSFVWFRQKREKGKTRSAIFVVDTDGNWTSRSRGKPVASPVTISEALPNGKWSIRYRKGLWSIDGPRNVSAKRFTDKAEVSIGGLIIECFERPVECDWIEVGVSKKPIVNATVDKKLKEASRLNGQVTEAFRRGKASNAIATAHEAIQLVKNSVGEFHDAHSAMLNNLAALYSSLAKFDKAEETLLQVNRLLKQTVDDEHPDVSANLNALGYVFHKTGRLNKAEAHYLQSNQSIAKVLGKENELYAIGLDNMGIFYEHWGDFGKAEALTVEALKIFEQKLGKRHPSYSQCAHNLATIYMSLGDYVLAERLFLEALSITEGTYGKEHVQYAMSLGNLASLYIVKGDPAKAEVILLETLGLLEKVIGRTHPTYAETVQRLGRLYMGIGEYNKAEPRLRQAVLIWEKTLGKNHPRFADSLFSLAGLVQKLKNYKEAESLCLQATAIHKSVVGETHPRYASCLNNLGTVYEDMRDFENADKMYRAALKILKNGEGRFVLNYATSLNNLSILSTSRKRYQQALEMGIEAKEIREKMVGKNHPMYANSLHNLAAVYQQSGEFHQAEKLYLESVAINQRTIGKENPLLARSLDNLAHVYEQENDFANAEKYARLALEMTRTNIEKFSSVQSEKQQRLYAKSFDDRFSSFVSYSLDLGGRARMVWDQAVRWKGMNLVRQKRNQAFSRHPSSQALFRDLQQVRSRLSRQVQLDPSSRGWKKRVSDLRTKEEDLEKKLAQVSIQLGVDSKLFSSKIKLPPNSSLINFRRFYRFGTRQEDLGNPSLKAHYLGMVMASDGEVSMKDLGPAHQIDAIIAKWREPIERANRSGRALDTIAHQVIRDSGTKLKELIWNPLKPFFGDSSLIVVSPDSALGRFPLIALPGEKKGTYLLEDRRIVCVPVPGLLPALLDSTPVTLDSASKSLLVGDINFGKASTDKSELLRLRNNRILNGVEFSSLANTKTELVNIGNHLKNEIVLTGVEATEERFRDLASESKIIHLATHGFFRPPGEFKSRFPKEVFPMEEQVRIAIATSEVTALSEDPNLLSGLALANANESTAKSIEEGAKDGILFSAEIAMLPMEHVELAVLSACETGLGTDDNPGEGLIGIQRAFQVAGAKSVVASYWKVDDKATQLLMSKFYENLLKYSGNANPEDLKSNRSTIRIDALRDAQLWMLNNPVVASSTNRGEPIGIDPDKIKKAEKDLKPADKSQRTHPRYWAAFMLSGDWR